jgi:hypothetical protein
MLSIIFLGIGLIQLALVQTLLQRLERPISRYALLVSIVGVGLAFDNFVLALGTVLGEGPVLKAINWPRFAIHALFTPTMMIATFGMLRQAGIGFAQSRRWHIFICSITTLMILLGSYIDILRLNLVPESAEGVIRYRNDFVLMPGPPIPAVLTIVVAIIFGLILWRRAGWPWLLVGSALMFITAPLVNQGVIQNLGEIAFAAGLVSTLIHTERKQST